MIADYANKNGAICAYHSYGQLYHKTAKKSTNYVLGCGCAAFPVIWENLETMW